MKKTGRILLVILVLAVASALLYPSFKWYFLVPTAIKQLAAGSDYQIRDYVRGQAAEDIIILKSLAKENPSGKIDSKYKYLIKNAKSARFLSKKGNPDKWTNYTLISSFPTEESLFEAIESHLREELLGIKAMSSYILQLGLDLKGGLSVILEANLASFEKKSGYVPSSAELSDLLSDDIDVLTARINQFGVSEPNIRLQGNSRILVEISGENDPDSIEDFIRSRGSLTFQIVDNPLTDRVNKEYHSNPSKFIGEDGSIIAPDYIPADRVLVGYYENDNYGIDTLDSLVVLRSDVGLDGAHLKSASVTHDSKTRRPIVTFALDSEGGDIFYAFTGANIGSTLAVVIDGKAKSLARIESAISDSVQISGGFSDDEAQALAVILRTASLPIDLKVVSMQSVGASLGEESVRTALWAILLGLVLVLLFVFIYYGPSGIIADFALLMNLYMMVAILSELHFTMTLASIAGIVLTLGMAIDSNVIIFERMKEIMSITPVGYRVVKASYTKTFWPIMDSNITTLLSAIALAIFGTGSVRGFATTLSIGIACSFFTSIFVSHLLFDLVITEKNKRSVRLSWRRVI